MHRGWQNNRFLCILLRGRTSLQHTYIICIFLFITNNMQNSVKEKGEEVPPGKQTQENQKTHKYHANILLYCSPETRVVH